MEKEFAIDLNKDFTEEEAAAIKPDIRVHTKEEQIISMYKANATLKEITSKLTVSTRTVYEVLEANGVEKRVPQFTQKRLAKLDAEDKKTIADTYKEGKYTTAELLAVFDLNKHILYTILDELGVPRKRTIRRSKEKKPTIVRVRREGDELMILLTKHGQESIKKVSVSYEV